MKSENWIIVEIGGALMFMGGLSFFVSPAYEKGVWAIMGALIVAFGNAMGTKSGSKMPQQVSDAKPGQTTESETKVTTIPVPPPEAAPVVEVQSIEKEK